jgi:hypothetical protein
MVLVLSRGGFCPKDRRQAEGLAQLHLELEVSYCRLVTISTGNITQTNEYRTGVGAHWPDWDITRPELKAAWQEGRKELFYSYGKKFAQTLGEQD